MSRESAGRQVREPAPGPARVPQIAPTPAVATPAREHPANPLAVARWQASAGNRAVSRVLSGSRTPGSTVVQRGLWGMDKPPNTPMPAPDLTEKLRQYKNPAWASFQLRSSWSERGRDGADQFRSGLIAQVAPAGPDEQSALRAVLDAEFGKIEAEEKQAVETFASTAVGLIQGMLETSEKSIDAEMKRYGFAEKTADGKGTGEASLRATADYSGLATAAREITEQGQKMVNKQLELQRKFAANHRGGPMEDAQNRAAIQRDVMSDPGYLDVAQAYQQLYTKHSASYPILAAYRNRPLDVNAISQGQKSAGGRSAAASAGTVLLEKKRDIGATRNNLASGKLSLYGLPNIVTASKNMQGATAGTLKARFVDDKVAKVASDKAMVDMALGAIAAAAMIAATIATAGGAAIVAGAATGVSVGIGGAQLYEHLDQFAVATAAGNTDLDRAQAISQNDPSLFWLAMDIALFVTDLIQAGQLFRQLAGPVRKLMTLRQAAGGGAKVAEADAAKIAEVFEKEVKPAADMLPGPAREKVVAAVDPGNVASAAVKAAGTGKWTWKEISALLNKTPDGRNVLALVDKYGLTVSYSSGGKTYYSHQLKTIFISDASVAEDAMNALVHEVEHADWRMTGKSAMGEIEVIGKEDFIQRMCREEASAEARTIRNKYSLQVLLDKKVMAAPTEQFYHDAFVRQAQALSTSSLPEAEKLAIAARKAENELGVAFYQRKIATSVDGADYFTYYGQMWEKNQMPATVRNPPRTP